VLRNSYHSYNLRTIRLVSIFIRSIEGFKIEGSPKGKNENVERMGIIIKYRWIYEPLLAVRLPVK